MPHGLRQASTSMASSAAGVRSRGSAHLLEWENQRPRGRDKQQIISLTLQAANNLLWIERAAAVLICCEMMLRTRVGKQLPRFARSLRTEPLSKGSTLRAERT